MVDIETGLPLSGAHLTAGSFSGITGADGSISVVGVPLSAPMVILAQTHIRHDARLGQRDSGGEYNVIPTGPGFSEEFLTELFYAGGRQELYKPIGSIGISISSGIDAGQQAIIAAAATDLSERSGVTMGVGPGVVTVTISKNPEDPEFHGTTWGAYTRITVDNHSHITAAAIVLRIDLPTEFIEHELGHAIGLSHVTVQPSWMNFAHLVPLTPSDGRALGVWRKRHEGTRAPDDTRGVLSGGSGTQVFRCAPGV